MVDANAILSLWVILFSAYQLWMILLTILNMRDRTHSVGLPDELKDVITPTDMIQIHKYLTAHSRLNLYSYGLQTASALTVVTTGTLGMIDNYLNNWLHIPLVTSPLVSGVLFVFLIALANKFLFLPLTMFRQFSIEVRFGFSKLTLKTFLLDQVKKFMVIMAIGVPSLLLFFSLIATGNPLWWIYAFLFVASFQILANLLYQPLVAPLFNQFKPLAEGPLKLRLEKLVERLRFKIRAVFVMDSSRRSSHSNAYFSGFGRTKSIVLFDTLVETLNEKQTEAVVAHEIGHQRLYHVPKHLILTMFITFLGLWLTSVLLRYPPLFAAFGFHSEGAGQISGHGVFIILFLLSGPAGSLVQPLLNCWLRHHEYEADLFSARATGGSQALVAALINLSKDNLSNPNPHPLYSAIHHTHPPLIQRLSWIQKQTK